MDLWSFLFMGLNLVGSLLIFYAGYMKSQQLPKDPQKDSDDKRKQFTFLSLSLLSLMLGIIGTILNISAGELKSQHSQNILKRDLGAVKTELIEKNHKIEELNEFILSSITGGDSFCYLTIGAFSPNNSAGGIFFTHKGKYPIHGITVRIHDLSNEKQITSELTIENLLRWETILDIGTLYPDAIRLDRRIDLPGKKDLNWNIFFSASNGFTIEKLRMKIIKGKWQKAIRLLKRTNEILYEEIDPDFPKDETGVVKWD